MDPTTAAVAAAPAAGGGMNAIVFMFIAFLLIFMFLSSRTNKKREAEQKKVISSLQKGDKVILLGGIVGTVAGFNDNLIEVKISETSKLSVLPSGIVSVYGNLLAAGKTNGAK
jgi:preprotein translocase subunit YajC